MERRISRILVLAMMLVICLQHCRYSKRPCETRTEVRTDTFYVTKIDTVRITESRVVKDIVVDTVYLPVEGKDTIGLEISQRKYSGDDFNLWVSGYMPKLDSIDIFRKTEYITVEKKVRDVVYRCKTDFYIYGGTIVAGNKIMPNMGLQIALPKRWMFGAGFGVFENKITYQLNIGYRL